MTHYLNRDFSLFIIAFVYPICKILLPLSISKNDCEIYHFKIVGTHGQSDLSNNK
jgi:hypothetical protein